MKTNHYWMIEKKDTSWPHVNPPIWNVYCIGGNNRKDARKELKRCRLYGVFRLVKYVALQPHEIIYCPKCGYLCTDENGKQREL